MHPNCKRKSARGRMRYTSSTIGWKDMIWTTGCKPKRNSPEQKLSSRLINGWHTTGGTAPKSKGDNDESRGDRRYGTHWIKGCQQASRARTRGGSGGPQYGSQHHHG